LRIDGCLALALFNCLSSGELDNWNAYEQSLVEFYVVVLDCSALVRLLHEQVIVCGCAVADEGVRLCSDS
jgi:hypothetical protein